MGMHVVRPADTPGDLSRPRAVAASQSAPALARLRTGSRGFELRAATAAGGAPLSAASSGARAPSGVPAPPEMPVAINDVAAARLGRALSMQRRRQMSQGKQALNGGGDRTPAEAGAKVRAFIVYPGGAS